MDYNTICSGRSERLCDLFKQLFDARTAIDIAHTPVRFADSPLDIRRRIRFDQPACNRMRTDSSNILYRNRRAAKKKNHKYLIFFFYNQNVVVDFRSVQLSAKLNSAYDATLIVI